MIVYCQYYQKARLICFPSTYKTGGNFKKSNNLNQKYNKQLHHFFFMMILHFTNKRHCNILSTWQGLTLKVVFLLRAGKITIGTPLVSYILLAQRTTKFYIFSTCINFRTTSVFYDFWKYLVSSGKLQRLSIVKVCFPKFTNSSKIQVSTCQIYNFPTTKLHLPKVKGKWNPRTLHPSFQFCQV